MREPFRYAAKTYCRQRNVGGDLAKIGDQGVQDEIEQLSGAVSGGVWIALHRQTWAWLNGGCH